MSDGRVIFIYKYECTEDVRAMFQGTVKELMPYHFLRFCLSLDILSLSSDILGNIPLLMASQLPQFEFEKNLESKDIFTLTSLTWLIS